MSDAIEEIIDAATHKLQEALLKRSLEREEVHRIIQRDAIALQELRHRTQKIIVTVYSTLKGFAKSITEMQASVLVMQSTGLDPTNTVVGKKSLRLVARQLIQIVDEAVEMAFCLHLKTDTAVQQLSQLKSTVMGLALSILDDTSCITVSQCSQLLCAYLVKRLYSMDILRPSPSLNNVNSKIDLIIETLNHMQSSLIQVSSSIIDFRKPKKQIMTRQQDDNGKAVNSLLIQVNDLQTRLIAVMTENATIKDENYRLRRILREKKEAIDIPHLTKTMMRKRRSIATTPITPSISFSAQDEEETNFKAVILFTGIMESCFDSAALLALNVKLHTSPEFTDQITHVVTEDLTKRRMPTVKMMAASLTGKWILDAKWLHDSITNGVLLGEELYGFRDWERPFRNKTFHMTANFVAQQEGKILDFGCCQLLIERVLTD